MTLLIDHQAARGASLLSCRQRELSQTYERQPRVGEIILFRAV